ncbi:hypothetical protein C8J57DRAFT_1512349 [Mycena rebaudengoi]|nr:hypothetical protein C8J57DRAFT_1512349 [Mycena rebaudengoi]
MTFHDPYGSPKPVVPHRESTPSVGPGGGDSTPASVSSPQMSSAGLSAVFSWPPAFSAASASNGNGEQSAVDGETEQDSSDEEPRRTRSQASQKGKQPRGTRSRASQKGKGKAGDDGGGEKKELLRVALPGDPERIQVRRLSYQRLRAPRARVLLDQARLYEFDDNAQPQEFVCNFRGFEHSERNYINGLLEKQGKGKPLLLDERARGDRDDNPSLFRVFTRTEFAAVSLARKQELLRGHCVVITGVYPDDPPPAFNKELLAGFRNPSDLCKIHDFGLEQSRQATNKKTPSQPEEVLTVVRVDSDTQAPMLPGWNAFATHERAQRYVYGTPGTELKRIPTEDVRWVNITTPGALARQHVGTMATAFNALHGRKVFFMIVPPTGHDYKAQMSSRLGRSNWDSQPTEVIVLGPNQVMYMPAGLIHFVYSLEYCLSYGFHGHTGCQISLSVWTIFHNTLASSVTTNADHTTARFLLLRVFRFMAEEIMAGNSGALHVPCITSPAGLHELMSILSFVAIYSALDSSRYGPHQTTPPMESAEAYSELLHVQSIAAQLRDHIAEHYTLKLITGEHHDFHTVAQDAVVTMAGALITYRHAVTNDNPAFTPAAFKDAIYWAVNRYPCEETLHRLEDRLDNGDEFLCFLPWEDDAPPLYARA